jgi:uncharacterized repeat protein (TIGR03803 family)
MDSAGNLYGTTYSGGANNLGTVFQVTPAGVLTVLYSFTGGTDGQQPYAGLVADSGGNLYGTTSFGGNNNAGSLFRITMAGAFTNLYTFNGSTGSVDGQQSQGGLVIDSAGNIYGTTTAGGATGGGTVYKLD